MADKTESQKVVVLLTHKGEKRTVRTGLTWAQALEVPLALKLSSMWTSRIKSVC